MLLIGHVGKLVKLAGGIMDTHSRTADCRTELFCAHAAVCGADAGICRRLMGAATADGCIEILKECGLDSEVMGSLMGAVREKLVRRAKETCRVGAVVFSNRYGVLGTTAEAAEMMREWRS